MNDHESPRSSPSGTRPDSDGGDYLPATSSEATPGVEAGPSRDWTAWLDLLHDVRASGLMVKIGAADDRLVFAARARSYRAFGTDSSPIALDYEPSIRTCLVQADPGRLPFRDRSADIVVLFNILEKLPHPSICLAEAARILKPDGLLLGATPDPVFLNRPSPAHSLERPPSFWIRELAALGFSAFFRFSSEPGQFHFVAAFSESETAPSLRMLRQDELDERRPDIVELQDDRVLKSVVRSGWGPLRADGRALTGTVASIYLLNTTTTPRSLQIRIQLSHTPEFSTLRVRLNSQVLADVALDSELTTRLIEAHDVLLPSGGHHLFFELFPGGPAVTVQSIAIRDEQASPESLTLTLPFDLFQRYRLCADVIQALTPDTILDVGGYLGDENGHLAVSHDFFQPAVSNPGRIRVTDVRQCDHPDYGRALAWEQPFPDQSFDLVVSLDVLEHLSPDDRNRYLAELDRLSVRWILLGAPFASPEVEEAERRLAAGLMSTRRFLQEHRERGLPERRIVEDFARAEGYDLLTFPNGYLPRWCYWQVVTQHYFALNDYEINRRLQALYNGRCYPADNREPAYRTIYLISKRSLTAEQKGALAGLVDRKPSEQQCMEALGAEPEFLAVHNRAVHLLEVRQKALTDAQFLANAREQFIKLLKEEVRQLTPPPRPRSRWRFWRKG